MKTQRLHKIIAAAILLCISVSSFAETESDAEYTSFADTNYFNQVKISQTAEVVINHSDKFEVKWYWKTKTKNNPIYIKDSCLFVSGDVKALIDIPAMNYIEVEGASQVIVKDWSNQDALVCIASGASDMVINTNTESGIFLQASGASDIKIAGTAGLLMADFSGASDLKAKNLTAKIAVVNLSGASDAAVSVVNALYYNSDNISKLNYSGEPFIVLRSDKKLDFSFIKDRLSEGNTAFNISSVNNGAAVVILKEKQNKIDSISQVINELVTDSVVSIEIYELQEQLDGLKAEVDDLGTEGSDADFATNLLNQIIKNVDKADVDADEDEIEENMSKEEKRAYRRSNASYEQYLTSISLGFNVMQPLDWNKNVEDLAGYSFLEPKFNSFSFDWIIAAYGITICRNLGINVGVGCTWQNYKFADRTYLTMDFNGAMVGNYIEEPIVIKSKLTATYVTIPLMLEFQTNRDNLIIDAGIQCRRLTSAHTKMKFYNTENTVTIVDVDGNVLDTKTFGKKYKEFGSFGIEKFNIDAVVRVGNEDFYCFATYPLNNMFRPGLGPEVRNFTVGIGLHY